MTEPGNKVERSTDTREQLIAEVATYLHAGDRLRAATVIADWVEGPEPADEAAALAYCRGLLEWCLNANRYEWAAQLLWPRELFDPRPRATQMIWAALRESATVMLMGAASMSKSYSTGVWLLLDWLRDPEYTTVYLVGPTEEHLTTNLFTHLVTMHSTASIPLPGVASSKLYLGLDRRRRKSAIQGVIIPQGQARSGRLQGRKRFPRPSPHPQFGTLSRIRFFLDELERIPAGIWKDLDNVFANISSAEDVEGFKVIGAFNPEDINGPTAMRCEPPQGWEAFDPEVDERWVSKRGWTVVRLDAAKCENVVEGRVIFPGLQTREGFEAVVRNSGGKDTPGYWTMARACFPPAGGVYSVVSPSVLYRARGEPIWAGTVTRCAGVDIALEGRDRAVMAVGTYGLASGVRQGRREEPFLATDGVTRVLRWVLVVEQCIDLPRGDTVAMASAIRQQAERLRIPPGWLIVDRAGNGAGVHDVLRAAWSSEVQGFNGTFSASSVRILAEDVLTPREEYGRALNEAWFAVQKWLEHRLLWFLEAAATEEVFKELSGRRYYPGRQNRVETKIEYRLRGNPSPHYADAVVLLVHGVRMASQRAPAILEPEPGVLNPEMIGSRVDDADGTTYSITDAIHGSWAAGLGDMERVDEVSRAWGEITGVAAPYRVSVDNDWNDGYLE